MDTECARFRLGKTRFVFVITLRGWSENCNNKISIAHLKKIICLFKRYAFLYRTTSISSSLSKSTFCHSLQNNHSEPQLATNQKHFRPYQDRTKTENNRMGSRQHNKVDGKLIHTVVGAVLRSQRRIQGPVPCPDETATLL